MNPNPHNGIFTPLERALASVTIPELGGRYFSGWRPGKSCASPFREDRKASFSIFADGRAWKDFATGEARRRRRLPRQGARVSLTEAARELIALAGTGTSTLAHAGLPRHGQRKRLLACLPWRGDSGMRGFWARIANPYPAGKHLRAGNPRPPPRSASLCRSATGIERGATLVCRGARRTRAGYGMADHGFLSPRCATSPTRRQTVAGNRRQGQDPCGRKWQCRLAGRRRQHRQQAFYRPGRGRPRHARRLALRVLVRSDK